MHPFWTVVPSWNAPLTRAKTATLRAYWAHTQGVDGFFLVLLFVDIGTAGGSTLATIVAGVQVARKVRERRRRRCRTSSMVGGASKWWRRWFVATDRERYRKRGSGFDEFFGYIEKYKKFAEVPFGFDSDFEIIFQTLWCMFSPEGMINIYA